MKQWLFFERYDNDSQQPFVVSHHFMDFNAVACIILKAPSLEDFSHLPPEQRRKRLQQRIDELHKELQKEMDQR